MAIPTAQQMELSMDIADEMGREMLRAIVELIEKREAVIEEGGVRMRTTVAIGICALVKNLVSADVIKFSDMHELLNILENVDD